MEILFNKGKSKNCYPVKLVFMQTQEAIPFPAQAMFVVPKKNFKSSPDRNTLKRRMREAYRLEKNSFYTSLKTQNHKVLAAFIYTGKKKEDYAVIAPSVHKLLNMVIKKET